VRGNARHKTRPSATGTRAGSALSAPGDNDGSTSAGYRSVAQHAERSVATDSSPVIVVVHRSFVS